MTTPTFTTPPLAPDRQEPSTFPARADAFVDWQVTFQGELDTAVPWIAATASTVASDAAAAESAKVAAVGAFNFQGSYDAGTLYAIGESVSYLDLVWLKKTTAAAGTTPTEGADWTQLSSGANVQTFTSSGTWTKPGGVTLVYVEAVAPGGGGSNVTTDDDAGGGGGGQGASKMFAASDLSATELVTIGAPGVGGASGGDNLGSDGGNTSFGSAVVVTGGKAPTSFVFGGEGGGGQRSIDANVDYGGYDSGGGGNRGYRGGNSVIGGAGGGGCDAAAPVTAAGTSVFGGDGGASNKTASTAASDGAVPGGGGGASSNDGGGGDGGAGRVIVWSW
jgi:hypothetical protein